MDKSHNSLKFRKRHRPFKRHCVIVETDLDDLTTRVSPELVWTHFLDGPRSESPHERRAVPRMEQVFNDSFSSSEDSEHMCVETGYCDLRT